MEAVLPKSLLETCCGPRKPTRQLKVLFAPGCRSTAGPHDAFVTALRAHQGLDITPISRKAKFSSGFFRRSIGQGDDAVVASWLEQSVSAHKAALEDADRQLKPMSVLLTGGSGVAIAGHLLSGGHWVGPTIMLCPDVDLVEGLGGGSPKTKDGAMALYKQSLERSLRALPPKLKRRCLLVHGAADETVPLSTARSLSQATGIHLLEVSDADHELQSIAADGSLARWIHEAADPNLRRHIGEGRSRHAAPSGKREDGVRPNPAASIGDGIAAVGTGIGDGFAAVGNGIMGSFANLSSVGGGGANDSSDALNGNRRSLGELPDGVMSALGFGGAGDVQRRHVGGVM